MMIFTVDNELHRFAIKKLQKEIEEQTKINDNKEAVRLRFIVVNNAWAELLKHGIDDDKLYNYKYELEIKFFK
jgi:hypothetical protein